jgi:hypothetical protein
MKKTTLLIMVALGVISSCAPKNLQQSSSIKISESSLSSSILASSSNPIVEEKKFSLTDLKSYVRNEYYTTEMMNAYNQWDVRLDNKTIPEFLMSIDNFLFVPPVPEKGFMLPYVIKFPSGKYLDQNKDLKKYMMLGGFGFEINSDYRHSALQYVWQNVYDNKPYSISNESIIAEKLNVPILTPLVTWLCSSTNYDQVLPTNMDRDSVLASINNIDLYYKRDCFNSNSNIIKPFMKEEYPSLIDIEMQFYNIVIHSIELLKNFNYELENKVLMNGFSTTGNFVQRFATVYPEIIKAYSAGGIAIPILPGQELLEKRLIYPIGTYDHKEIFKKEFDSKSYNNIAKINYIGRYETNFSYHDSAVRGILNSIYSDSFQLRWSDDNIVEIDSLWNKVADLFYNLGGSGMFLMNKETKHYTSENDLLFILEFFRMNANSDTPVYPTESKYSEHLIRLE